jgi:Na+-transporting NADH:ubiquinone oxidoreductase subunit NqrC
MWYVLPDSNMQYPLSIETVKKIKAMNMKGIKVEQLETTEVNSTVKKEIEPQFVDVVGQISLRTLERNSQKRKQKARDQREGNNPRSRDGNRDNRENPNRDNRENRNKDNRDNRNKGGGSAGGNNSGSTGGKRDFRPQKPKNQ